MIKDPSCRVGSQEGFFVAMHLKEAAGSRFKVKKYRLHPTELAADGI